jgi:type II secretory pathway pseudopilin PulG
MELMVVIVIIGIIAGFALPQYQRAIRKSIERDAIAQLSALWAANNMYRAVNDVYWPGANQTAAQINAGLNLNLIQQTNCTYTYTRLTNTTYTARMAYVDGVNNFTIELDEGALAAGNPACVVAGTCPSL